MRVLVINSGSSTLKFDLVDVDVDVNAANTRDVRRLAHGVVDRIGRESNLDFHAASGQSERREVPVNDHHEAVSQIFAWLNSGLRTQVYQDHSVLSPQSSVLI